MKRLILIFSTAALLSCGKDDGKPTLPPNSKYRAEVENYNYSIGTQAIGKSYSLTPNETVLVETAKRVKAMGSNILKITLAPDNYNLPKFTYTYDYELLEKEPSFKTVAEMNFSYYVFWTYGKSKQAWQDGLTETEAQVVYDHMYKLTEYLLRTFKGTGKEFYLGHWEGDWHLTATNAELQKVDPVRIQGMIDWYNNRQKGIDDAKKANPDTDVKVYHYCEVNRVFDAKNKNYDRVTNKVLPYADVDFVSYSSYDAINTAKSYEDVKKNLGEALNYIESNMKPKPEIEGKRVFIGEYGYKTEEILKDRYSRNVMKYALEWGCPFVLCWVMYDEYYEEQKKGEPYFALVDYQGNKTILYNTHHDYYKTMKSFVNEYFNKNGKVPSRSEFYQKALTVIQCD